MRTSDKLKLAWPALLKLAKKGSVSIYYRGVDESGHALYQVGAAHDGLGEIYSLLTESQLLDRLMSEGKENQ